MNRMRALVKNKYTIAHLSSNYNGQLHEYHS